MNTEEKERLARTRDTSMDATAARARAARMVAKLSQAALAGAINRKTQVISNIENARSYPGRDMMVFFHREHRIDFNFIIHGDFAQLAADVQEHLFDALSSATNEADPKQGSGPNQGA